MATPEGGPGGAGGFLRAGMPGRSSSRRPHRPERPSQTTATAVLATEALHSPTSSHTLSASCTLFPACPGWMRPGTRRNQRRQPQPARAWPSAARPAAVLLRLPRFPPLLGRFREVRPLPPPGLRPSGPGGSASRPVGPVSGSPAPSAAGLRPSCSGGSASRLVGRVSGSPAPSAARPAAILLRWFRFPPCWAGFGKPTSFRRPACGHPAPAAPLPALLGRFREVRPLPPPGLLRRFRFPPC